MVYDEVSVEERDLQAIIAAQAEEIARLRRQASDASFVKDLQDTLNRAALAGAIAAPVTHAHLLEMIVATAAHVIAARAASLFLVDEETHELTFEVALGQKAAEAKRFRVPLGHGIAGLVALTGQPMAIANAQNDPRHAADIARQIGYLPRSILCVPLFYDDRVVGVLELLDKEGAPSFGTDDMEALGLFAQQAAVALELSRTQRNLAALIGTVVESLGHMPERQELGQRARVFASHVVTDDPAYRAALDLAGLVQQIAAQGESERLACRTMLHGFAAYVHVRSHQPPAGSVGAL